MNVSSATPASTTVSTLAEEDDASNADTATLAPEQETALIRPRQKRASDIVHSPLLGETVAATVSSISLATRVSLRSSLIVTHYLFVAVEAATCASFALGRDALLSGIHAAHSIHASGRVSADPRL